ncbi:MAG: NUDIX domain-containing protein [Bacillota bacterium]
MEIWDVYDENRILTGRTMERGSEIKNGDYHIVIHVCIFNSKNEMLIQHRQSFKEGWPNMWDLTVGGSALAGESSTEAAEREMFEEIGYKTDLSFEDLAFTLKFDCGFDDFYIIRREIDENELTLQFEEVQAVKWASKEEILEMVDKNTFIDHFDLERIFERLISS